MPFSLPRAQRHPNLICHGCGQTFNHKHGAGLHCSPGCEGETKTRKAKEEQKLQDAGFTQHAESLHTWIKDGVGIPIEFVIREGHHVAIQKHAEAVRNIAALLDNHGVGNGTSAAS